MSATTRPPMSGHPLVSLSLRFPNTEGGKKFNPDRRFEVDSYFRMLCRTEMYTSIHFKYRLTYLFLQYIYGQDNFIDVI